MDYSQLSDFDINRLVAMRFPETYLFNEEGNPYQLIPDSMAAYSGIDFEEVDFQPCGNPADAWPIISENKINIEWHEWKDGDFRPYALNSATMKSVYDGNPLRAAMIVFLMMEEQENA